MLITYTNRNKYGGYTHEIKFTPILELRFIEMDPQTINVEFVEKRILFGDKIFFSYVSHVPLVDSVINAFGEIIFPIRHKRTYELNIESLYEFEERVLDFMRTHNKEISELSIVNFKK